MLIKIDDRLNRGSIESFYNVTDVLVGTGGFGEVRQAIRKIDNLNCAVKYIPHQKVFYSEGFRRNNGDLVPNEVMFHSMCKSSTRVVQFIEWFLTNDGIAIVTVAIPGSVNLARFIAEKHGLNEPQALQVFLQAFAVIFEIENYGIFHGDIKCENFIVWKHNSNAIEILLLDFGLAKFISKQPFSHPGTSHYMPPEFFIHRRFSAQSCNVWWLGCLLYQCLQGFPPFSSIEEIRAHEEIYFFSGNLSETCKDIIKKCLERDPLKRIDYINLATHPWVIPISRFR